MSYGATPDVHYVRRQRWMIAVIIMLAFVVVLIRVQLHPGFDENKFQGLYDHLCTELKERGDGQELYQKTRKVFRHAGTKPEVLFLYQFVGIYAGELEHPPKLAATDVPIYNAIVAGDFEEATALVHAALIESDDMTEGRARAWGKIIRELQPRWSHDCHAPVPHD